MPPLKISWWPEPGLDDCDFLLLLLSFGIPDSLTDLSWRSETCSGTSEPSVTHTRSETTEIYFLMNLGVEVQARGVMRLGPLSS